MTDADGHTTRFSYDNRDRLVKQTAANGGVTSYGYDAHGNLTSLTDPDGNLTTFQYDAVNRLIAENRASLIGGKNGKASATVDTTQYTYSVVDELLPMLLI